ncbi:MAG: FAD-dependent oxidoreductase [Burkholderiaceae bacterium]
MKIAVIGAGIIGVTAARELAADGHQVTAFEGAGSVAAESSFANPGILSPGLVTPWSAPGAPARVLRQLLSRTSAVRMPSGAAAASVAWAWRCWRASRSRTYAANCVRMQRLAYYSREQLHRVTRAMSLDYERSDGCLMLLRTPDDLARAQHALSMLRASRTRFEVLDAARCREVEPALNPQAPLHAGIHLPDDEVGNCRQFANLLRAEAQRLGVHFQFHTRVQKIVAGSRPELVSIYAPPEEDSMPMAGPDGDASGQAQDTRPMVRVPVSESFDAVIVCAALGTRQLLRPHGLKLPLLAVHGHSITAPLRTGDAHPDPGPRSAVIDERHDVTICRLGRRVRVAGGVEIGGSSARHDSATLDTLYKVLDDWFPGCARLGQAQTWKGARPMLPDGPPIVGHSGIAGVWLNVGHGSNGWALACGSARLLTDLLAGRPPGIDTDGLGVERLKGQ